MLRGAAMKPGLLRGTFLASCLLLASCGDAPTGGAPSTSTPMPLPTPTPTPTPTPITYAAASDFTRDRTFSAAGIRITIDRSGSGSAPQVRIDPEGATIGFEFAVATRTYTARYLDDKIAAVTNAMGEPSYDQFIGANSNFLRAPLIIDFSATGAAAALTYAGYVKWNDDNGVGQSDLGTRATTRRLLFGARTLSGDIPATGTAMFTGQSDVSGPGGGGGGAVQMIVDFTTRKVSGSTVFSPSSTGGTGSSGRPPPPSETISFSGALDPATGRVSGAATHVLTGAIGMFEGALYGPAGAEVALLFVIQGADNGHYFGAVGGRR